MTDHVPTVLRAAASLLEQPGKWTQGEAARNENGRYTPPRQPGAVCWCAAGAILCSSSGSGIDVAHAFKNWLFDDGYFGSIGSWNDAGDQTQENVVATLRRAADYWESKS